MPGITAGVRVTVAPGVAGASPAGPAKVITGPSSTTTPASTGSPRPGISRSASMRIVMDGHSCRRARPAAAAAHGWRLPSPRSTAAYPSR
jgi:hypothetical protein